MMRRILPAVLSSSLLFAAALSSSCASGEGVEAPFTIAPDEQREGDCPAADDLLVNAKAQLNAGAFDPMRPFLERVLVDEGGLATGLTLVTTVLPEIQPETIKTLLGALTGDDAGTVITTVLPHLLNVIEYLQGSSPFVPGAHLAPIEAAHRIVVNCRTVDNVGIVRDLLALEVVRAPNLPEGWTVAERGQGEASWLGAFVDSLARANEIPKLKTLLEQIKIGEDGEAPAGGESVVVGKQAFIILSQLLAGNIAAPDFQLAPVRELLDDVMVPVLDGDAEANAALDELLDLLGVLVTQQSSTFETMQAFMGCVDRHDSDAAIPVMLFDYLTIDELSAADLLTDLAGSIDGENTGALRLALVDVLDVLLTHGDKLADNGVVLGKLIAPDVAPTVLDLIVSLEGTGVTEDLAEFFEVILGCKDVAP